MPLICFLLLYEHKYVYDNVDKYEDIFMKTIQMTIDERLLELVDKTSKKLRKTRSELIRVSLRKMLHELRIKEMENRHRVGYRKKPITSEEFNIWEDEQVWV
jgi:Arc/MetJ-type ribon-helix-helix transcriptional regulator